MRDPDAADRRRGARAPAALAFALAPAAPPRGLVAAQAEERRMPELSVLSPFREPDLRDQIRTRPVGALLLRPRREGTSLGPAGFQPARHVRQDLLRTPFPLFPRTGASRRRKPTRSAPKCSRLRPDR